MSDSDSTELSDSNVTSDEFSSNDSKPSWEDTKVEGSVSPSPLLCTTVSHHHERERVDNFRVPAFESHTTAEWLSYNSLEALGLTLKDVLSACRPHRLVGSEPSAAEIIHGDDSEISPSSSATVIVSRMDVNLQLLQPFEERLERALELHIARRNWLLTGSRKVFGQLTGSRVAVLFEVSNQACELGQLMSYIEMLQDLLQDQLTRKRALFLASFGSKVLSLWNDTVSVDEYRLQEAAHWIQSLSLSTGCNVLSALKLALKHRKDIDEITLILRGRPDQDMSLIADHLAECLMGQQLPIHTVAYNCSETEILDFLRELAHLSGGTYHCHSDAFPDSEDINSLEREIQRVQNVIDQIKALKHGGWEQTLSLLLKEVTDKGDWLPPTSTVLTSPLTLKRVKRSSRAHTSRQWLQTNSLKSLHLTLYQVLAPNSFPKKDGYCAVINKRVSAHIHNDHMAQLAWHDGSIKHVHVDPAQLEDYQRKLDNCEDFYKKRLDWLCSGSQRVFGTIAEKRVVVLLDISLLSLEQLSRFQEHVRLLLEEQLSAVQSFNLISFAGESVKWRPSLVETTTENLQDAWRWVLGWDFGGSCNLLSALQGALEYRHDSQLTDDPDAVYVVVSGHPDQMQTAVLSYVEECLVGRVVRLHTVFYDPSSDASQFRSPGLVATRYFDKEEMSHYLSCMAHTSDGRYHSYSESGCAEGDDLREIQDEIAKCQNYYEKVSMLLERVDQIRQNRLLSKKDHTTALTAVSHLKQPPREPRDTAASLARKQFIQSQVIRETESAVNPKQRRPQSAPQPRYLTHSHFYTGYGISKVMALDQLVLPRPRSFSIKAADIPKAEERVSSKAWLKKYGLSKIHLNLNHLIAELGSGHRTEHIATVNREAGALHCCNQPKVMIKGVEWHLRLRPHELLEYESKLQQVIQRYEKRLHWLRGGSRGVFGAILEDQIVLLLDASGTMAPSLHQLKLAIAALVWEQLHSNSIKFNIISFSSEAVTWHESLGEPTEAMCQSAVGFVSQMKAEGGTNVLQGLELSLKIPDVAAIYLVMNGKPEQSSQTVLETANQLNTDSHIPIHTVSFDCSDDVTNKLLKQLAHQTHGRFHRCAGKNCGKTHFSTLFSQETHGEFPTFEGDDLQCLDREIRRSKQFLAQSKLYREQLLHIMEDSRLQ